MSSTFRTATISVLAASLLFAIAACKPLDKDAASKDKDAAAATEEDGTKIAGLKDDKEKASYMIGMQIGQSLKPIVFQTLIRASGTCPRSSSTSQ